MRRLVGGLFGLAVALSLAAPAAATPTDDAAQALRRDPVYVDPSASPTISPGDADGLRDRIREGARPVFIAVLPASAGNGSTLAASLQRAVGLSGTYGVAAGDGFGASSAVLPNAAGLASAAHRDAAGAGLSATLLAFVDRVEGAPQPAAGSGVRGGTPAPDEGGRSTSTAAWLFVGVPAALVLAALLWWRDRRHRVFVADRDALRADVGKLADDVVALEPDVTVHAEAKDDYDAAVDRFRAASAAVDSARSDRDVERARRVFSEAQYSMARARARAAGDALPGPPQELMRPGRHDEPAVAIDKENRPVYLGYQGAWYGSGWWGDTDPLTGVMLGGRSTGERVGGPT